MGDVTAVLPFNNEVDLLVVKGSVLREQLEYSVTDMDPADAGGRFMHFSGELVGQQKQQCSSSSCCFCCCSVYTVLNICKLKK